MDYLTEAVDAAFEEIGEAALLTVAQRKVFVETLRLSLSVQSEMEAPINRESTVIPANDRLAEVTRERDMLAEYLGRSAGFNTSAYVFGSEVLVGHGNKVALREHGVEVFRFND